MQRNLQHERRSGTARHSRPSSDNPVATSSGPKRTTAASRTAATISRCSMKASDRRSDGRHGPSKNFLTLSLPARVSRRPCSSSVIPESFGRPLRSGRRRGCAPGRSPRWLSDRRVVRSSGTNHEQHTVDHRRRAGWSRLRCDRRRVEDHPVEVRDWHPAESAACARDVSAPIGLRIRLPGRHQRQVDPIAGRREASVRLAT